MKALLESVQKLGKTGWLLLAGLLGVLLLAWGSLSTPATAPAERKAPPEAAPSTARTGSDEEYALQLEASLAQTLSQVAGAGKVSVRVFLSSGPRYEYARKTTGETRTTQESEKGGTSRVTSEQRDEGEVTVMRGETGGRDEPVVVVARVPEIQGVLVVAEGAAQSLVRLELTRAVETALGLPAHRVRVLAREAER